MSAMLNFKESSCKSEVLHLISSISRRLRYILAQDSTISCSCTDFYAYLSLLPPVRIMYSVTLWFAQPKSTIFVPCGSVVPLQQALINILVPLTINKRLIEIDAGIRLPIDVLQFSVCVCVCFYKVILFLYWYIPTSTNSASA